MKVRASIKKRNADCKIVRRKGHLYVINKKEPKMKMRLHLVTIKIVLSLSK